MVKKICDFCNKIFLVHLYRRKMARFCSYECYHAYQKSLAYQPKICPRCRKEFVPNRNTRHNKYCSKECGTWGRGKYKTKRRKVSRWRGERTCPYCGKTFKYTTKNIHQKYCSNLCQIKTRAYKVDENFFNKIDAEGKAYLLGLIFSDGSISEKRLNFSSVDKELVELFKKLMKSEASIYRNRNSFSLIIGNRNIYNSLKKLGVLERKSWKEYGLPLIPKFLMKHFIRGFFDGDGSFYLDNRRKWRYLCVSFCCGSHKFLEKIEESLSKYKIKSHTIRFDQKPNHTGCWQLRISRKDDVKKFVDYLYRDANYLLSRKYEITRNFYG